MHASMCTFLVEDAIGWHQHSVFGGTVNPIPTKFYQPVIQGPMRRSSSTPESQSQVTLSLGPAGLPESDQLAEDAY